MYDVVVNKPLPYLKIEWSNIIDFVLPNLLALSLHTMKVIPECCLAD
jgi:hypothetical protein